MSTTVNGPDSSLAVSDKGAEQKIPYPGIPTTADGAAMVVWAEVHITQGRLRIPHHVINHDGWRLSGRSSQWETQSVG
jgi:hypothetical protein